MKLIQENPYRIVGILSNATAKEIQSRKGKITAYAKVGKQVTSEYDFPFLNSIERDHNSIGKAFSAIQQSKEMLDNSLFWFLKTNSFDETAITYLMNGDKDKAIEIWEKITLDKEVTSKNFSCFNNIGTLKLLGKSQQQIKEGVESKIKLIESGHFTNFVHSVASEAFVIDNQKQLENFLNDLLSQINGKFSNSDTLKLFDNCNAKTKNYLAEKFTEEPLHKIETSIESTKKKRNQNKSNAFQYGLKLYENSKSELSLLKSLLGISDLKYKLIADNLAKEIMQCAIDYFNESTENESTEDYLENAMRLTKLADSIAIGKLTKDKAKDHISTLEEMKDKEIAQAILVLQSIKDAYENACRQIDKQVDELKYDTFPGIGGGQPMRILKFNVSINWSKVEEMKRNALAWDKVVELILKTIPTQNIDKIKKSSNTTKVNEYKTLVNFLISKISYSYKNRVAYICYWETQKTTSSSSSSDEGIPDWIKWVGGVILFIILIKACN